MGELVTCDLPIHEPNNVDPPINAKIVIMVSQNTAMNVEVLAGSDPYAGNALGVAV